MKKWLLALALPSLLTAYAPLIPQGRATLDATYSFFDTDHFYDRNGKSLYSYNSFQRHEMTVLAEAGLSSKDNLSIKAGFDVIHDRLNGELDEFSDAELGWKRSLVEWDNAILSSELLMIFPIEQNYQPEVRYGRWGAEGALLYAQSYFPCDKKLTLDGRLAYRWYSGFPSDQVRSELSCWLDLSCRWQLLAQTRVEYGLDNGHEPKNISFFFWNAKYRVWQGKLEAIYYLSNRLALSAGYMRHFMGERIAVGGEWYAKVLFCF